LDQRGKGEVQFNVNGEHYMLNFDSQLGRWYLLRPVSGGMIEAIEVIEDEAVTTRGGMVHASEDGMKSIH
jgi:hypothetical protein